MSFQQFDIHRCKSSVVFLKWGGTWNMTLFGSEVKRFSITTQSRTVLPGTSIYLLHCRVIYGTDLFYSISTVVIDINVIALPHNNLSGNMKIVRSRSIRRRNINLRYKFVYLLPSWIPKSREGRKGRNELQVIGCVLPAESSYGQREGVEIPDPGSVSSAGDYTWPEKD